MQRTALEDQVILVLMFIVQGLKLFAFIEKGKRTTGLTVHYKSLLEMGNLLETNAISGEDGEKPHKIVGEVKER